MLKCVCSFPLWHFFVLVYIIWVGRDEVVLHPPSMLGPWPGCLYRAQIIRYDFPPHVAILTFLMEGLPTSKFPSLPLFQLPSNPSLHSISLVAVVFVNWWFPCIVEFHHPYHLYTYTLLTSQATTKKRFTTLLQTVATAARCHRGRPYSRLLRPSNCMFTI